MASDKAWLQVSHLRHRVHTVDCADSCQSFFQGICPGSSAATGWAGCDLKPDLLNVHAYTTDFATFKNLVTGWHDAFGLPMIVSEFACHVSGYTYMPETTGAKPRQTFGRGPVTQQAVHDFMGQTTAWMDGVDWIVKYAWFGAVRNAQWLYAVSEVNRLLDASGNVTPL